MFSSFRLSKQYFRWLAHSERVNYYIYILQIHILILIKLGRIKANVHKQKSGIYSQM